VRIAVPGAVGLGTATVGILRPEIGRVSSAPAQENKKTGGKSIGLTARLPNPHSYNHFTEQLHYFKYDTIQSGF
jgi:hypothetical protein